MTKPRKKSVRHSLGVKVEALRLLKGGSHVSTVAEKYNVCRSAVLRWASAAGLKTFPAKFRKRRGRAKMFAPPPSWWGHELSTTSDNPPTILAREDVVIPLEPEPIVYHTTCGDVVIPPDPAPAPEVYAYCPWCGHNLRDNSGFRFCPWCSHAI